MRQILALDGGGIRGIYEAAFLASVEQHFGVPSVANYFDLIAGTSTGGILALGLGLGYSAREILEFYEEFGPKVFANQEKRSWPRRVSSPAFDDKVLRSLLTEKFGDARLGESNVRLLIPAVNLETHKVHFFKTAHLERFEVDYKCLAVDVAMATAAAPTFFPAHVMQSGLPLIDGGIVATNPAGIAAVEAVGYLGWPSNGIQILSVGTTTSAPLTKPAWWHRLVIGEGHGWMYWGPRIVSLFMSAQASAAHGIAEILTQHNVVRVCTEVAAGRFGLDAAESIATLKGLGSSEARHRLPELREKAFMEKEAEPFVPHHRLPIETVQGTS